MSRNLNNFVCIKSRYHRSIHISRDWDSKSNLEKYHLTPTGTSIVDSLITNLKLENNSEKNGVFSIIGPFGTGKSAFALFLVDLFCSVIPSHPIAKIKRKIINFQNKPLVPILLVGKRTKFKHALLLALKENLLEYSLDFCVEVENEILKKDISDQSVIYLVDKANKIVHSKGYEGLFIVIDEFGKFLEYSAQYPSEGDIFVLQDLAEMIDRSEIRIFLFTILHSTFEGYLPSLDEIRRREWKKIQGRFKDIPLLEPVDQFLQLISDAIESSDEVKQSYSERVETIISSKSFMETFKKYPIRNLIEKCAPLHPITALILFPLFRSKLSQNERSLFVFLMDQGLYGFQDFLNRNGLDEKNPIFYRLDYLYDYTFYTLGTSVLSGDQSRRWAEISHALDRISFDAPELASSVIKIIGLINLYGSGVGLKADTETISISLDNQNGVQESIAYLVKNSYIVYRRYTGGYALWEGSDVNLEKEYAIALNNISYGRIAKRLNKILPFDPIIAKAYYIKKGTLRYYSTSIIEDIDLRNDSDSISQALSRDGHIAFILPSETINQEQLIIDTKNYSSNQKNKNLIIALPKKINGLEELLKEFETWLYVKENVIALANDPVARNEITIRLENSKNKVLEITGATFGFRGYSFDPSLSIWIYDGKEHQIESVIEFQRWISSICEKVFHNSPVLHNELINREHISSSASSARRNLIMHLVNNYDQELLCMNNGTPPELSIYLSMVKNGGFHNKIEGKWKITSPNSDWLPAWNKMKVFLESTQNQRRNIQDIVDEIKDAPFGIREGPIFLLLTIFLLYYKNEVAIFEDGYFVPELLSQVFERMTKQPNTFEIQYFPENETTKQTLFEIGKLLENEDLNININKKSQVLDIVKPLIIYIANLPSYTKKTRLLEFPEAVKIRNAILRAKDPYALIFDDLPNIIGIKDYDSSQIQEYISVLNSSLVCLKQAYPKLLSDIQYQITEVFMVEGNYDEIHSIIQKRAKKIKQFAYGPLLTFIQEATWENDTRDWREVFGRVICNGKPTKDWLDIDKTKFRTNLLNLAGEFLRLEEMTIERNLNNGDTMILRIGILGSKLEEKRQVVGIKKEDMDQVEKLSEQIISLIENQMINKNGSKNQLRLATIVRVAEKFLGKTKDE